jgi:nucleoid DNA-binding protein
MPPKGERKKAQAGKKLTKAQLVGEIADKTGLSKVQVSGVFEALATIAAREIRASHTLEVPGVARVVVRARPASAARQGRNPATGEAITIAAKPAGKKVKAFAVKALKVLV